MYSDDWNIIGGVGEEVLEFTGMVLGVCLTKEVGNHWVSISGRGSAINAFFPHGTQKLSEQTNSN